MKNLSRLVFLVIIFFTNYLNAQNMFEYGIKVGISSSSISATDTKPSIYFNSGDYYQGNSINPFIGLFLNYKLDENLILESELSYIQKGSRKTTEVVYTTLDYPDGDGLKTDYTAEIDLRYMELGFNVKPTIRFGNIPTYLIIGSSADYTLNAINITHDKIDKFIFSYKLGVGCNVNGVLKLPLLIELKYTGDFSQFYSYHYGNLWNKVLLINIGFNI
ncbi:MAG: outer membrane beta-barrel protein [Melioribacteraceae bacterium]